MKMKPFLACAAVCAAVSAQTLTQDMLLHPPADSWPTYNGDYSGRRFSPRQQIDKSNVHALSLAWATRFSATPAPTIKATPLMVNGILYFSSPNNAWAADART